MKERNLIETRKKLLDFCVNEKCRRHNLTQRISFNDSSNKRKKSEYEIITE